MLLKCIIVLPEDDRVWVETCWITRSDDKVVT